MSEQQDWAEKLAEEMIVRNACYPTLISNIENQTIEIWARTLKLDIAQALKKEREIAKLESNKAINFPTEIPDEKFIDVRDERCELVRFVELDWMKQTIKGLSE